MAAFVQPILQGLSVLKEHKAAQQKAVEAQQKTLQEAVLAAVLSRLQNGGGN